MSLHHPHSQTQNSTTGLPASQGVRDGRDLPGRDQRCMEREVECERGVVVENTRGVGSPGIRNAIMRRIQKNGTTIVRRNIRSIRKVVGINGLSRVKWCFR